MKLKFLILILGIILFNNFALADTGLCVDAVVTDISPTSIKIGKDFTVGVLIDNCGDQTPENTVFSLINPSPDISIKEPLIIDIGKMGYANSKRFLVYHMKISDDAKPGVYIIKTQWTYGTPPVSFIKDGEIEINVIGDEAKLNIASIKTDPVLPYEGETVELTLRIENFGDGTANSVKVSAQHPFQGIKTSFIGTLDSDEDGPAIFTFIASKSGEFNFPVKISYQDDFGENEIQTNVNIIILEKKINWVGIISIALLILIIIVLIFYYFKTKKEKNRIIEQLLKGDGENKKEIKKKLKKHKK